MQVVPLSDVLGAELVDFDITRPLTTDQQAELRGLFCRYHLLLVRGQELTPEDHDRFVASFGPIQAQRAGDGAGYVTNRADDPKSLFGPEMHRLLWHNDGAYGPRPGIATSLWAVEVGPTAAPTLFANVVDVVDRLPPTLRDQAGAYRIQNVRDTEFDRTFERVPLEEILASEDPDRYVTFEHPLLFQPPHIAGRAVIASEQMTTHVVGLPIQDSDRFLEELYSHVYGDENVYAHHWQRNDVLIWDNIALHHGRPEEVGKESRHLRRQCIDGWYNEAGELIDWTFTRVKVRAKQPRDDTNR
jgi:taurine dioxygenase